MDKTYRNSNYKNVTTYRLVLLVLLVKHILRFLWANQDSNQKSVDSKHRILISKHVRIDNSFALYFETVLVLQCPKFEAIIEKNVKRKTSCVFNCMPLLCNKSWIGNGKNMHCWPFKLTSIVHNGNTLHGWEM